MPLFQAFQRKAFAVCVSAALVLAPIGVAAQSLIRDADIEYGLRQVAQPIFQAAGLSGNTKIYIIADSSLNAFVINNRSVFLHSGLLARFETPGPVQAVLAHEAAHIANGHLARRAANFGTARTAAGFGIALAIAAAAVGGADAGIGVAAGTGSAAMRQFFAHTRAEEASADQSALRYMATAGVDPAETLKVLDLIRGQEALSVTRRDPYAITHPLTRDRYRAVQGLVAALTVTPRDQTRATYFYQRSMGKLTAFLRAPSWTFRRVGRKTDEISTMRRAIAYHRQPDANKAIAEMQKLLAMKPNDPFYRELYGQILLESRQVGAAVQAYRQAATGAPGEPLILAGLGRALLAQNTASSNREALTVLTRARGRDPSDPRMLRDLALAHARAGQNGLASVATAERYALQGRLDDAELHANRAVGILPQGSRGALRAQDVLSAVKRAKQRR